jgi:molybdate transport system substrate-binding protein
LIAVLLWAVPIAGQAEQVTVFAAASLKTALDDIAQDYQVQSGDQITLAYAGSGALARQIQYGAPAQLFISAHPDWMDTLQDAGQIAPGSRVDLLGNHLVLIAPADAPADLSLSDRLGDHGRLAMGLLSAVPAGIYGQQALEHLGLWDQVAGRVAQVDNVRAALALVAVGQAPAGIVYGSDALAEPRVQVITRFGPDSHDPIRYPAALIHANPSPAAQKFLTHLQSPPVQARFQAHGFQIPKD